MYYVSEKRLKAMLDAANIFAENVLTIAARRYKDIHAAASEFQEHQSELDHWREMIIREVIARIEEQADNVPKDANNLWTDRYNKGQRDALNRLKDSLEIMIQRQREEEE